MTDRPPITMHHIAAQTDLNRMGEKRADRAWIDAQRASPAARFHLLIDLKFPVRSNPDRSNTHLRPFSLAEIAAAGLDPAGAYFLGLDKEGAPLFAVSVSAADALRLPGGADAFAPQVDLRTLLIQSDLSPREAAFAAQARSLAAWHPTQRCCGRCGGTTEMRDGGWRRECWACGQQHFPRSDPAVIMLITWEGRALLGHEPRFTDRMYSVLAGFVEPGDDIETAVRREIREETGVRVGRVDYIASQPWPFPHSLMIGCWGEALTSELTLDPGEIADARWFTRDDVRQMLAKTHPEGLFVPPPLSISHTLIRAFADGALG